MAETAGLDGIRASSSHAPLSTAASRLTPSAPPASDPAEAVARDARISRAVLGTAIGAVAVLVLLMPATPLVGFVLLAAISLGVVALLVRRAEDRRSTGDTLKRLTTRGYLVLAERVAPALTGTIGHLVIGPGGVFVIETRDQTGRVRIRGDQLIVGRHSHSVASQLRAQVAAVNATLQPILAGTGVQVVPLVCMRYAELPLLTRSVAGIPLLRQSQLGPRIARSATVLDEATIARLGARAEETMPASGRRRSSLGAHDTASPTGTPRSPVRLSDATDVKTEPLALGGPTLGSTALGGPTLGRPSTQA